MSDLHSTYKCASPNWPLDDKWAIGTDPYNWVLYRKIGRRWQAVGYYARADQLLESLFRKLTRTEPFQPELVLHVRRCFERVQGMADRLAQQLERDGWRSLSRRSAQHHS